MIRPAARMQKKTPVCMTAIESIQSSSVDVLGVRPDAADAGVVDDDVEPAEVGRRRT